MYGSDTPYGGPWYLDFEIERHETYIWAEHIGDNYEWVEWIVRLDTTVNGKKVAKLPVVEPRVVKDRWTDRGSRVSYHQLLREKYQFTWSDEEPGRVDIANSDGLVIAQAHGQMHRRFASDGPPRRRHCIAFAQREDADNRSFPNDIPCPLYERGEYSVDIDHQDPPGCASTTKHDKPPPYSRQ
jgi:hypothetical protein